MYFKKRKHLDNIYVSGDTCVAASYRFTNLEFAAHDDFWARLRMTSGRSRHDISSGRTLKQSYKINDKLHLQ